MAESNITFRLAAYSDAAGKLNPEHPLRGNEDNFLVDADLTDGVTDSFTADATLNLGPLGCLLVVADGMGGMNAGEVASEIAIATVRDLFATGNVSAETAATPDSRRRYMENVIREADRRVKADAAANPEHAEMGSTMILVWILGDELTVSWIGDSRAYRYNPVNGIEMLSEDHSYVQDLVRKGILTYEQTFDHPQGNIVTRSLGDPSSDAQPESRQYTVNTGDIIIVCSDGLSGVLRDCRTFDENGLPYPGDNIQSIVAAHQDSMTSCREALWTAAEAAGWYDNVTVILCQILGGAPAAVKKAAPAPDPVPEKPQQPAPRPVMPPATPASHHSTPSKRPGAAAKKIPAAGITAPDSGKNSTKGASVNPRTLVYASIGIVFIIAAILVIAFSGGNDNTPVTPIDRLTETPETQIAGAAADDSRPSKPTQTPAQNGKTETAANPTAGNPALDAAMKVSWKRTAIGYLEPIITEVPEWKGKVTPLYNDIIKAKKEGTLGIDAFAWNQNHNYLKQIRQLKKDVQRYPVLVNKCNQVEKDILENATDKGTGKITGRWGKEIQEITDSYNKSKANSADTDALKDAINK